MYNKNISFIWVKQSGRPLKETRVWLWARCNRSSWSHKSTERHTKRPPQHLLQASGDPRLIICFIFCVEDTSDLLECAESVCLQLYWSTFISWISDGLFDLSVQFKCLSNSIRQGWVLLATDVIFYMATEKWNPAEKTSRRRLLLADPYHSKLTATIWQYISKGQFDSQSNALWTVCLTLQISLVVKLWVT